MVTFFTTVIKPHVKYFFVCSSIFLYLTCGQKSGNDAEPFLLDPRYKKINHISSTALCLGPYGSYTTSVDSEKNGKLMFTQTFSYKATPFHAEIRADNTAYQLDENNNILDTLSPVEIEMIRSHNFHRIQTDPGSFYKNFAFEKKSEEGWDVFTATDRLNHPVKLFYDVSIGQIRKINLMNMLDTTQSIELIYKNWNESDYGKLARNVEIIQAGKDTFTFEFTAIRIQ